MPVALPDRLTQSHKGDYGRALVVGGSRGMAGSIALTGSGCLRAGAGLVTVATPSDCQPTVAAANPCYMTLPLAEDADGRIALSARRQLMLPLKNATAVACGPGLGLTHQTEMLVRWLFQDLSCPLVLDADGLNALVAADRGPSPSTAAIDRAMSDSEWSHQGPRVLTPHPGEFVRMLRCKSWVQGPLSRSQTLRDLQKAATEADTDTTAAQQTKRSSQCRIAREFAQHTDAVVVLKGHRTFITDGHRDVYNETGNPGMATGGSGDVLTGIICGLICQGLSAFDAACHGTHLHGLAGDIAVKTVGQVSLVASDLLEFLPAAIAGTTDGL